MTTPVQMAKLLAELEQYKRTPEFNIENVPKALLSTHTTKAGVWGLIRVLNGSLRYHIDAQPFGSLDILAGGATLIKPETPHHVEFLENSTVFFIEFYRPSSGE